MRKKATEPSERSAVRIYVPFIFTLLFAIIGFDAALELFPPFIDADFYSYVRR